MSALLSALTGDLIGYLVAAVVGIAGFVTFGMSQRRKGRRGAENDAMKDSAKRQEKGRDAVQDLHDADRDELDRKLRDNDEHW